MKTSPLIVWAVLIVSSCKQNTAPNDTATAAKTAPVASATVAKTAPVAEAAPIANAAAAKTAPVANATAAKTAPVATAASNAPNFQAAGIEDVKGFATFVQQLQTVWIEPAQKEALAKVIVFPIPKAKDKKFFLDNYDKIITPKVREAVKNQKFDALMCRDQGCMMGKGEVWLSTNKSGGFGIVGINP